MKGRQKEGQKDIKTERQKERVKAKNSNNDIEYRKKDRKIDKQKDRKKELKPKNSNNDNE